MLQILNQGLLKQLTLFSQLFLKTLFQVLHSVNVNLVRDLLMFTLQTSVGFTVSFLGVNVRSVFLEGNELVEGTVVQ